MIDRERLLAGDHQATLHAQARIRRLAADAAAGQARTRRSAIARARLGLGRWLVGTGHRLEAGTDRRLEAGTNRRLGAGTSRRIEAGTDPCGPAEARPA
jgi:hypothetical protein